MCDIKKTKSIFVNLHKNENVPEVICVETDLPQMGLYDVLVQVKVCGLVGADNRDRRLRQVAAEEQDVYRVSAGNSLAGIVLATGDEVTSVAVGDHVVGILPLDSSQSGCSDYVVLGEHEVCIKPPGVSWVDAAGSADDAFKAYVALIYLGRLSPGDTVLVAGGASSAGSLCVQLAHNWRTKVITTCTNEDEKLYLQTLNLDLAAVVQLGDKDNSLKAAVMMETGNLGVDLGVDLGTVQQFQKGAESSGKCCPLPTKHEMISCLGVGGRWVTATPDLQLDPPDTSQLRARCASVCFLFEQAWLLSCTQQGRYQHILRDVLRKVQDKVIRPNIHHTVPFDEVARALTSDNQPKVGRIVMTSLP